MEALSGGCGNWYGGQLGVEAIGMAQSNNAMGASQMLLPEVALES